MTTMSEHTSPSADSPTASLRGEEAAYEFRILNLVYPIPQYATWSRDDGSRYLTLATPGNDIERFPTRFMTEEAAKADFRRRQQTPCLRKPEGPEFPFGEKICDGARSELIAVTIDRKKYAVKMFKNPDDILREYKLHWKIYDIFSSWWLAPYPSARASAFRCLPLVMTPMALIRDHEPSTALIKIGGYMTEHMEPLNLHHAISLTRIYTDKSLHKDLLSDPRMKELRLVLRMGEIRPEGDHLVKTIQDRPVYLDQMWRESDEEAVKTATSMGTALALLHWQAHLNARGVKFHLGYALQKPSMFITHFGDCEGFKHNMDGLKGLVSNIMDDPAWPRPPTAPSMQKWDKPEAKEKIWAAFKKAYTEASQEATRPLDSFDKLYALAVQFIGMLEAEWLALARNARVEDAHPEGDKVEGDEAEGVQVEGVQVENAQKEAE